MLQRVGIDRYEAAVGACAVHNLRRASRNVTRYFDEVLEPSGLKATQLDVLITVWRMEGATIGGVADALAMDRTTLTRGLNGLETRGLISIIPAVDRRARRIRLTDQGRGALEVALPLWHQAQERVVQALGDGRWAGLLRDLIATSRIR
jgi:DNA-binding MarR family transcriptional regulator